MLGNDLLSYVISRLNSLPESTYKPSLLLTVFSLLCKLTWSEVLANFTIVDAKNM